MTISPQPLPELDYAILDRELDRTKTSVFLGTRAAFLGPLMCSMDFQWSMYNETAWTNGLTVGWNPHFFMRIPKETRKTVLVHELWHPGFLHMLRCGARDHEIWNCAADIIINNMLDDEKYSFEGLGFKPWLDHKYDGWTTEEVYDDLLKKNNDELRKIIAAAGWAMNGGGDIVEPGTLDEKKALEHTILSNVVGASHQAQMSGAGNMPGEVEITLKKFLSPKLPWAQILSNFFNELANKDYSWARPNRRYQDMYLPSMVDDQGGLDHLIYYLDVSGSISDGDIIRFHSEFKYVKEQFEPEKMTMVQFDTIIQKEDIFLKDDPFEETHVIGRGGTSLVCVRDHILKHNPTAVVIFSDMCVSPMDPLPSSNMVPIIWVALNASNVQVPHGQVIHLNE